MFWSKKKENWQNLKLRSDTCKYPFPTQNAADKINVDQFLSENILWMLKWWIWLLDWVFLNMFDIIAIASFIVLLVNGSKFWYELWS